jgi:predicted O-methyltransferase YrrM
MIQAPTYTLLKKAVRHPVRAFLGGLLVTRLSLLDKTEQRARLMEFLSQEFAADIDDLVESYERSPLRTWIKRRHTDIERLGVSYRLGATPEFDCESLFFLVRAVKPRVVVETGVCYGVSSSYILEALDQNGAGELYSIDLGNKPGEPPNDFFVPRRLKGRWHLILDDAKQALPHLLEQLGEIDIFHHDSLHTYEHMTWEYETALRHLSRGGALSSHDVRTVLGLGGAFQRNAFGAFCERHKLRFVESYNTGVAVAGSNGWRAAPHAH